MGVRVADGYAAESRRGRGLYIKMGLVAGGGWIKMDRGMDDR